jgi:hypothetical protein
VLTEADAGWPSATPSRITEGRVKEVSFGEVIERHVVPHGVEPWPRVVIVNRIGISNPSRSATIKLQTDEMAVAAANFL